MCATPVWGLRYRLFPSSQKVLLPCSRKMGSISPLKIGRLLGMLENFWSSSGWEESLVRMRNRKRLTPFLPLQPFQPGQAAACASTPGATCTRTQSHSPALSASCQPETRRWGPTQDRSGTRGRLRVAGAACVVVSPQSQTGAALPEGRSGAWTHPCALTRTPRTDPHRPTCPPLPWGARHKVFLG